MSLFRVPMSDWDMSWLKCQMNFFVLLVSGLLAPGQSILLDSVRFASKKSGSSCKNVGGKSPGRRYGFKKQDGNSYFVQSDSSSSPTYMSSSMSLSLQCWSRLGVSLHLLTMVMGSVTILMEELIHMNPNRVRLSGRSQ